ncbi:MAG: hypothetical protein COB15_06970 [Flavobacteriales bacterium]|nr:MAG: hypothetical protein COB15_06970 [Flavobacteriales bacterium]
MSFGLADKTIQLINLVFSEYEDIEEVIIYGSRVKGSFKNGSDIDLTLKGKDLTLKTMFSIEDKLDDLLLPYTIDISIFSQINNSELIDHINRLGEVFYQK